MDVRTRKVAITAGAATGALAGAALGALAGTGAAQQAPAAGAPWIEATHFPPLLRATDERVELRFDAFCFTGTESDERCRADAEVYVKAGAGEFERVPVVEDEDAREGRYVAAVPAEAARSQAGFSYYAVLRDRATGAVVAVPAGGASAPLRSRPLVRPTVVDLGRHVFGSARAASSRVVAAPWGQAAEAVGLESVHNGMPVGGASFDVTADGVVHILDEAKRRVLRWRPGAHAPEAIPLEINGTIADLAVGRDGELYVLETTAPPGEPVHLRAFTEEGRSLAAVALSERGSQLRLGQDGVAHVLQQPSGLWTEALVDGRPAGTLHQRATGRVGRALGGDEELVVLRTANEIRVALVDRRGTRETWRITSDSDLAEVQLAERAGRSVVLVVRAYTGAEDEFRVLVLDQRGLVDTFAVASAEWAESAPLSRFRLVGSSLYQLGSSRDGVFVDRFDLEVNR